MIAGNFSESVEGVLKGIEILPTNCFYNCNTLNQCVLWLH